MSTASVRGAECSLLGWPPLSQLDEFVWGGLGEFNILGNFDQPEGISKEDENYTTILDIPPVTATYEIGSSTETSPSSEIPSRCTTAKQSNDAIQKSFSSSIVQFDSLGTITWDAMAPSDLTSMLDSTLSCESSMPIISVQGWEDTEDGYGLYDDNTVSMERRNFINGSGDIFMDDPICDDDEDFPVTASSTHLPNDGCSSVENCRLLEDQEENKPRNDLIRCHLETISNVKKKEKSIDQSSLIGALSDGIVSASFPSSLFSPLQNCKSIKECMLDGRQENLALVNRKSPVLPSSRENQDLGLSNQCSTVATSNVANSQQPCVQAGIQEQFQLLQSISERGEVLDGAKSSSLVERIQYGHITPFRIQNKTGDTSGMVFYDQDQISQAQANQARRLAASQRRLAASHRRAEERAKKQFHLRKALRNSQRNSHAADSRLHQGSSAPVSPLPTLPPVSPLQSVQGEAQSSQQSYSNWYIQPSFQKDSRFVPPSVPSTSLASVKLQNDYLSGICSGHLIPSNVHQHQQEVSQQETSINTPVAVLKERLLQSTQELLCTSSVHQNQKPFFPHQIGADQCYQPQRPVQSSVTASNTDCRLPVINPLRTAVDSAQEDDRSLEFTVLKQLESAISQLSVQTRLCIRNALYRLAKSARERSTEAGAGMDYVDHSYFPTASVASGLSSTSILETQTNPVDRQIASLLFCKPSVMSQCLPMFGGNAHDGRIRTLMQYGSNRFWNADGGYMKSRRMSPIHTLRGE